MFYSGLERPDDPILVSAAHCNSLCRDQNTGGKEL